MHVFGAANEEGGPLVQGFRNEVSNRLPPVAGPAAGLFNDHGHRGGFIHQPKLAIRVLRISGIEKDAALQQRTVKIRDKGTNIAPGVGPSGVFVFS